MSTEQDALKRAIEASLKFREAMKKTAAEIEKEKEEEKKRVPLK